MEVILGSQAHHVPHVGLPQIEPVTKAMRIKTKPDGAKLFAIIPKFLFLSVLYYISSKISKAKKVQMPQSLYLKVTTWKHE